MQITENASGDELKGGRLFTRLKTFTSRWPKAIKTSAVFNFPS
ncbi:hypothetical protein [Hoeflea sp.]|jgi:hypothetical protein